MAQQINTHDNDDTNVPHLDTNAILEISQRQELKKFQELLDELPDEQKARVVESVNELIMMISSEESMYSGPIPPPNDIEAYNNILPNAAERIFSMAEKEQDLRIYCMKKDADNQEKMVKNNSRGQLWGGFLVTFLISIALILGLTGHDAIAITIATTTILAVAAIFVLNKLPSGKS